MRSRVKEVGFEELIDLEGNKHKDFFVKEVDINNIEGLIEIKKPILDFKGLPEERKYLSKNSISNYINKHD